MEVNCFDILDRRLSREDGRPPLCEMAVSPFCSVPGWPPGFDSPNCPCEHPPFPSASAVAFESRAAPASSGRAVTLGASFTAWVNLSASLLNFTLSFLSCDEYKPSGRRNWHCKQTEKDRVVGLAEKALGGPAWNCTCTGRDVPFVRCILDRSDCRSSVGIDCMADWRALA